MTLTATLEKLATLEASLPGVKRAYAWSPERRQQLVDFPCWINTYSLVDVLGWGELRVERYGITAQCFCRDADQSTAARQATAIGEAFLKAFDETHGELYAQTVGLDLRTLTPTLGMLEWANQGYPGVQFLIDVDVSVPTDTPFDDVVLATFEQFSLEKFPHWQYDPRTWAPTDAEPALYWHYVNVPHWVDTPLTLDWSYFEATLAARIAAPARTARTSATIALSRALGRTPGDAIGYFPDTPWLELLDVSGWPQVEQPAEGQLLVTVRFGVPDECEPDGPWQPGSPWNAVLTYADVEGSYGPRIMVGPDGRLPPPPFPRPGPPVTFRELRAAGIRWRALLAAGLSWRDIRGMSLGDILDRLRRP